MKFLGTVGGRQPGKKGAVWGGSVQGADNVLWLSMPVLIRQ